VPFTMKAFKTGVGSGLEIARSDRDSFQRFVRPLRYACSARGACRKMPGIWELGAPRAKKAAYLGFASPRCRKVPRIWGSVASRAIPFRRFGMESQITDTFWQRASSSPKQPSLFGRQLHRRPNKRHGMADWRNHDHLAWKCMGVLEATRASLRWQLPYPGTKHGSDEGDRGSSEGGRRGIRARSSRACSHHAGEGGKPECQLRQTCLLGRAQPGMRRESRARPVRGLSGALLPADGLPPYGSVSRADGLRVLRDLYALPR